MNLSTDQAHGFVWPEGMPPCGLCGYSADTPIHVTPNRVLAAGIKHAPGPPPLSAHAYVMPSGRQAGVMCKLCNRPMSDSRHPIGMPPGQLNQELLPGRGLASEGHAPTPVGEREHAFVAELGDRLVIAGRGTTAANFLTPAMTETLRQKSSSDSPHVWVSGRYVEADTPNRNAAFWSTEDLEMGEPTVAHGPINWLHEEKHVIGSIAATELVRPGLQVASEDTVGNHIVALGAVWPWLYPAEAAMIRDSSEAGSLWFSMECISRTVACRADGCDREMAYADYMRQRDQRCDHMKDGAPRRFVDPIFNGAGIIVPPVRPGWAKADARVLMPQAAKLAERQAAAFDGMETSVAETIVAQLIANAE